MKARRFPLLCLLLALLLLLGSCGFPWIDPYGGSTVHYRNMEYVQPDMQRLDALLEDCRRDAEAGSLNPLIRSINAFYDAYDSFYTNYALADIRYCGNLNDLYWEQAFDYCQRHVPEADAALDELYFLLADSPLRQTLEGEDYFGEGFFDGYDSDTAPDAHYVRLLEEEAELVSRYYALCQDALAEEYGSKGYYSLYGTQMAELFVEMIAQRQEIAEYAGYDSYPQYAYDANFYRDYTPEEAEAYLEAVGSAFYDLYCGMGESDVWSLGYAPCGETQTFEYVKNAAQAMGGDIAAAFSMMETYGLYDISHSENKYDASFETYLWSYGAPFIFMNPQLGQRDKLTFAHEFGHFLNDYCCFGSYAGTDVAEVHSQAFEYLSLCYTEDAGDLTKYKMADSLGVYMECAAYALFEQQVYRLTGDALTVENVEALYTEIGTRFGFDTWVWDPRDYVTVTHFFTDPMYNISYVVSNDLAMQFYRIEKENPGKGLELYLQCLGSEDSYIIAFAEQYGLESPFDRAGLEQTADLFREVLAD